MSDKFSTCYGLCIDLITGDPCLIINLNVTSVNLMKAGMASQNIVMKKAIHFVLISFAVVFGLLVFGS